MPKELRVYVSARVAEDVIEQAQQIASVAEPIQALRAALKASFGADVSIEIGVVVPKPRAKEIAPIRPLEEAAE